MAGIHYLQQAEKEFRQNSYKNQCVPVVTGFISKELFPSKTPPFCRCVLAEEGQLPTIITHLGIP